MTDYSGTGNWWDCDWVRFRMGMPEKMGGWQKNITTAFLGSCRSMINWTILSGASYIGLGTNIKYYVSSGGSYTDVTPIRSTVNPMANNPFASALGLTTVTVTDVANGSVVGDYVTYSTTFAGIPAAELNAEHVITSIISNDSYTIEVTTAATSSASGGGAVVIAEYQINIGLDTTVEGLGWGAGAWGRGGWGTAATSGVDIVLRLWSADTFGEDMIANVRNGGIYYWDATNPSDRMVALEDLAGASDAPVVATQIMVSAEENHVIAFGCNPTGTSTQDPLEIRWSDAVDAVNWTAAVTNSAGEYRLSIGTRIVTAAHTRSEILVWTDMALYSQRWTGTPYTFSFTQVGTGTNIIAPNAAVTVNDICIWMGREQFYIYDGRMSPLPCPVSDYLFRRMNYDQLEKVFGYSNSLYDEVGWLYPSDTDECDSYIVYNYKEKAWYFGSLSRTAWLDRGPSYYPQATSADNYLYDHEYGFDDGSTDPVSGITAYIESSPMETQEGGQGDHFQFVSRLIPDVTFRDSTAASPEVSMTVKMRNYPGTAVSQSQDSGVTSSATVPVQLFTDQCFIRLRGRMAAFRCESSDVGVTWRLGVPRIDIRPDGRR